MDAIFQALQSAVFAVTSDESNASVLDSFMIIRNVSVRQESGQLAGEEHSVTSNCDNY